MHTMKSIINGLDWTYLTGLILSIIPALICITVHEMSHGLASYLLGDKTAKEQKRISLNPLRHIDPIGLLMLVVFKFGWAKPVSVDMRNFKNPKRDMALSALAGPIANIILACLLMFIVGFLSIPLLSSKFGRSVIDFIIMTARISIYLGIFNLIPIPPLDGSKVFFALLPDNAYSKLMQYERYGMFLLIILLFTDAINGPLYTVFEFVIKRLSILINSGFKLYEFLF